MLAFIRKFLLRFYFIRFLRSFFYARIIPSLKYLYFGFLIIMFIFVPYYIHSHDDIIINIKNRIVNKYVAFLDKDKKFYKNIVISGNNHISKDEILAIVKEEVDGISSQGNGFEPIIKLIKDKIKELPWVKNVVISRNLPDNLVVKIEEYEPFAIWQDDKKHYIIDKNGEIITNLNEEDEQFSNLLILSGKKANLSAKSLFNIMVTDLEISKNIYSATWVGFRRWDIRFNNDLLVKLPENNIEKAWKNLVKIYNMPGSLINLKTIDLRVEDKVFLEYDDESIKEFKSL